MSFLQLRSKHNQLQLNTCPVVTTQATSSIADTTATGNGTVISVGGSALTERGVCWSTSINPTVADSKATSAGQTGAYTVSITGLLAGTQYYARAYAINNTCTEYGDNDVFTTTGVAATNIYRMCLMGVS